MFWKFLNSIDFDLNLNVGSKEVVKINAYSKLWGCGGKLNIQKSQHQISNLCGGQNASQILILETKSTCFWVDDETTNVWGYIFGQITDREIRESPICGGWLVIQNSKQWKIFQGLDGKEIKIQILLKLKNQNMFKSEIWGGVDCNQIKC